MKYLKKFESLYDFENPCKTHIEHVEEIKSIFLNFAEENELQYYDWTNEQSNLQDYIQYTFISYKELKKQIDNDINIAKRLINKMFEGQYMTIIIQLEKQKKLDGDSFFRFDEILKNDFIKRIESIGYKSSISISTRSLLSTNNSGESYQINLDINYTDA